MNIRNAFIGLMLLVCSSAMAQDRAEVEFQTTEGNIRIALFNETGGVYRVYLILFLKMILLLIMKSSVKIQTLVLWKGIQNFYSI